MTTDRPAASVVAIVVAPTILSHSVRRRIFFYVAALTVLLAFGGPFGGLIDIPISFFLKNRLHLKAHEVADFRLVSSIPLYLSFVFGFIRDTWNPFGMGDRGFMLPLKTLLLWGTVVAVPQMVPLLFIHSVSGALIAAVPIGLMGGVATAAYLDLLIRSCPRGLQGTTLMMAGSLYWLATRFGNVLGTNLFDYYGGFAACVIAITVVYALILPTLLLVPKRLISTADGQTPEFGFAAD